MNGLNYVGSGFLPGVPAKDLTPEQAEQYGGEKALIASGLYTKPVDEKAQPAAKKADKE